MKKAESSIARQKRLDGLARDLDESHIKLAQFVVNHPWLTPVQIGTALELSEETVRKYLRFAIRAGLVTGVNEKALDSHKRKEAAAAAPHGAANTGHQVSRQKKKTNVYVAAKGAFRWCDFPLKSDRLAYERYFGLDEDPRKQKATLALRDRPWGHALDVIRIVMSAYRGGAAQAHFGRPVIRVDWEPDKLCRRPWRDPMGGHRSFEPDSILHFQIGSKVCVWAVEYARSKFPGDLMKQMEGYAEAVAAIPSIDGLLLVLDENHDVETISARCAAVMLRFPERVRVLVVNRRRILNGCFFNREWRWAQKMTNTGWSPVDFLRDPHPGELEPSFDKPWRNDAVPHYRGAFLGNDDSVDLERIEPVGPDWQHTLVSDKNEDADPGEVANAIAPRTSDELVKNGEETLGSHQPPLPDPVVWLTPIVQRVLPRWWAEPVDFAALADRSWRLHTDVAPLVNGNSALDAVDVTAAFAVAVAGTDWRGSRWWEDLPRDACRPGWLVQPLVLAAAAVVREEELHRRWGAAIALQASRGGPCWPEWLAEPPSRRFDELEARLPKLIICSECGDAWCPLCQGYGLVDILSGHPVPAIDQIPAQVCPKCHMQPCSTCGGSGVLAVVGPGWRRPWPRGGRLTPVVTPPDGGLSLGDGPRIVRGLIGVTRDWVLARPTQQEVALGKAS